MSRQITDAEALHLLRRQRHSFLNHLQVISGWLQLGRSERAQQYLETVAARMTGESDVLRQAPADLSLLVLELGLEAETHGVQLEWQLGVGGGPVRAVNDEQLVDLRRRVLGLLSAGAPGGIAIRQEDGGFSVHTPSGKGEG
ncbi:MAG TPA: Spo0B domain-containing protein [Symbiobacteriaceae bacterium]|nr:Spo0B domain-containing protein [Symbiobacteriaceae bacterium]